MSKAHENAYDALVQRRERYFLCPGCKKVWTGSELRYSEGDCPDHGDICPWEENIESEELIPKARHTALVEAVSVLMRDEILNDFDGGYLAHHGWVRRYAEQVGDVQDALAAAQEKT